MTKPTVHNPTNFDPAQYEVVDYLDNKRPEYCGQTAEQFAQECRWWEADMQATLGADWRQKIGHCVHCGNGRVRWITAVAYIPTGERVVFGADCTARLGFADRHSFKLAQLQARAKANAVRISAWHKREAFLAANPAFAAALPAIESDPLHARNSFAKDVVSKLNRFGSLSDAQVTGVLASLARDKAFAERKAAEATEVKGAAPQGRQTVAGAILSLKWQESAYGDTLKMLVKLDNNSLVWLTAPSGVTMDDRGGRVTVTATFEPKADDPSFAFGKRPILIALAAASAVAA